MLVERIVDIERVLRQVEIFRTLDEQQLRKVGELVRPKFFNEGASLFDQGDRGDCLYIITSGYVRIYLLSADGREITFRVYGPGTTVGEFAVLDGKERSAGALAVTSVRTLVIYRDQFRALITKNIEVLLRVVEVLTERLRYTTIFSQNLAFLGASGRVAVALNQLANTTYPGKAGPVTLKITQRELASYAGVSREWTNHALRDFAAEGIIRIERGAITILDRNRLALWADV